VGKLHLDNIKQFVPKAGVVALVEPVQQMLEETGNQYGIDNRLVSLEEALEKIEFEAVVITTPTFTHRDLAVMAGKNGKHVFLEKPMAINLQECDEIIDATTNKGLALQLSLTHGPGLPPAWANDLKTSNGMLAEVNSHDLDCLRWLAESNIDRIYLEVANFKGDERGATAKHFYDNMLANIKFESGALGSISGVCPCDYGYDARVEVIGKKGVLQIGSMQGLDVVVCVDREQGLVTPIYKRWPERFRWGYIYEMQHFIECIQTDQQPSVSGEDGRWAVAGVLAGTRSFLEERPVRLSEIL
jgi:myo-inositol 2-dehydrogenase/D-chiro-inositol 1-dehydrogenase/scyllo-inositol 2-dehydrogenase (NAD+)